MSLYTIYFSPTGGTKKVMEILAAAWEQPPVVVDLSCGDLSGRSFGKEDICLIGVPAFGGRVPAVALERLARLKADGTPAVLAATYGNRAYDDTLLELQEAAEACGFHAAAAVAAVTEHSIMRQYGAGRPDERDCSELEAFARKIRSGLESEALTGALKAPGNRPYRAYNGVPLKPKAGKACTQCGRCARLCPVGAIPEDRPGETDTGRCISCMRCIKVCPAGARSLNKVMLLASIQKLKAACAERKKNDLFLAGP